MQEYLRQRRQRERNAILTGVLLTLALHGGALVLVSFTGLKYLYPPPAETTMLIDFEQEHVELRQQVATQVRGEDVDREAPVNLVQRSESPYTVTEQNLTPATRPDDFGDVDVPTPPEPEQPALDPRASFPGMARRDTSITAPHSASESSDTYKAGQSKGNTTSGNPEGKPNAHLKGRTVNGNLPVPNYTIQESGIVVVTIWVDQYGTVQKAVPGADGTTVTNSTLWNAPRKAAMETKFNMSADAPALQEGTITYIFNLK